MSLGSLSYDPNKQKEKAAWFILCLTEGTHWLQYALISLSAT